MCKPEFPADFFELGITHIGNKSIIDLYDENIFIEGRSYIIFKLFGNQIIGELDCNKIWLIHYIVNGREIIVHGLGENGDKYAITEMLPCGNTPMLDLLSIEPRTYDINNGILTIYTKGGDWYKFQRIKVFDNKYHALWNLIEGGFN